MKCTSIIFVLSFALVSFFFINEALLAQSVGPDGSFNYSVDIKLPPGTAGMAPKLSLVYNSNGENGIMGMGWQLSGLPSIIRDTSYAINYDGTDVYTGENGRLVDVGGNIYHYEEETFSRFEKFGTQGDGPEYWVEIRPDGTKLYYGINEDARVIAVDRKFNGESCIRLWALSRVEDVFGNCYEIEYVQDNGEYYPVKIVYTQGNGLSKYRTVEFIYESRDDYYSNYAYGTKVETRKILKNIVIKTGVTSMLGFDLFGDLVRDYRLEYEVGTSTGRSRLKKVQEIGSDGGMLPSIVFEWKEHSSDFRDYEILSNDNFGGMKIRSWSERIVHAFDFNSDGMTDILLQGKDESTHTLLLIANGNGGFRDYEILSDGDFGGMVGKSWSKRILHTGDFNGDGMTDMLLQGKDDVTHTILLIADGNGSFRDYVVLSNDNFGGMKIRSWSERIVYAFDFNSDGMTDILLQGKDEDTYTLLLIADGNGGFRDYEIISDGDFGGLLSKSWSKRLLHVRDFNSDGMTDILLQGKDESTHTLLLIADGNGSFRDYEILSDGDFGGMVGKSWSKRILHTGDFSGNGMTDILLQGKDDVTHTISLISFGTGVAENIIDIYTSTGTNISIEYEPAVMVPNAIKYTYNSYPFTANASPRNLVVKVTTKDGRESSGDRGVHSYSTSYQYYNGKTYAGMPHQRKNLYFQYVKQVNDNTGAYSITYYKQDNPDFHGKVLRAEQYASNGSLMKRANCDYYPDTGTVFSNTKFVRLQKETAGTYEMGTAVFDQVKQYEYDDYGNVTRITDSATGTDTIEMNISYAYDTGIWILNRPSEVHKLSGGVTLQRQRFYYTGNNLTSKQEYLVEASRWITTSFGYDLCGNVTSVTNPLGYTTVMEYDSDYNTFVERIANPKGHEIAMRYDARFGKKISETDPNGNETEYEYDEFGRITQIREPGDDWTKRVFYRNYGDPNNQHLETWTRDNSDEGYHYQISYFDGLNREYRSYSKALENGTTKLGLIVEKTYNEWGKVKRESNPYNDVYESPLYTSYTYDAAGRLAEKMYPENVTGRVVYSSSGSRNVVRTIDPNNNSFISEFDARGRLVKRSEPENASVLYAYDPLGRLIQTTDAGGNITTIVYDSLGRKLSIDDPNKGNWRYGYDDLGRLTSQTDAKGQTISFHYDEINRILWEETPDGTPDVHYEYDNSSYSNSIGRLTEVNDEVSESRFSYDVKGSVKTWVQAIDNMEFAFNMEYDQQKRLTKLVYPEGEVIERRYADAGYLERISMDGSLIAGYSGQFDVDGDGNIQGFNHRVFRETGNGIKTEIEYDPANHRPLSIITKREDTVLEDVEYTFDPVGNIKKLTDNLYENATQEFQYDKLNRLIYAKGIYGESNYSYDSQGNLLRKGSKELYYGDPSHPHAVTGDNNGNIYEYDDNGNMTYRKDRNLDYDAKNRLTAVWEGNRWLRIDIENYSYDYTGLRVKKRNYDGTTVYHIGGLYEVVTAPARETHKTKYIYGIKGDLVAQITVTGDPPIAGSFPLTGGLYDYGSFRGFFMHLHADLNRVLNNGRYFHNFIVFIFFAFSLLLVFAVIYFRIYRREEALLWQRWAANLAPLVLIFFFATFGLTGCGYFLDRDGLPIEGIHYYHPDHLGSTKMLSDENGEVVSRMYYSPYGEILNEYSSGRDVYKYKYTAQEHDEETGLHYYKSRYYDPEIGRFVSGDDVIANPSKSQLFNRYAYVNNNPVNKRDPSGRFGVKGAILGGIIGAVVGGSYAGYKSWQRGNRPWNPNMQFWKDVGKGALIGGIIGASIGAGFGLQKGPFTAAQLQGASLAGGFNAYVTFRKGGTFKDVMVSYGIGYGMRLLMPTPAGTDPVFNFIAIGAARGGMTNFYTQMYLSAYGDKDYSFDITEVGFSTVAGAIMGYAEYRDIGEVTYKTKYTPYGEKILIKGPRGERLDLVVILPVWVFSIEVSDWIETGDFKQTCREFKKSLDETLVGSDNDGQRSYNEEDI